MNCYVDSSVVLNHLLAQGDELDRAADFEQVGTSELLHIETHRVLQRYRLEGLVTDDQLEEATIYFSELYENLLVFEMSPQIKKRSAEAFPTVIGSLDAIHLSTAYLWSIQDPHPLAVLTLDKQMKISAGALGLHCV